MQQLIRLRPPPSPTESKSYLHVSKSQVRAYVPTTEWRYGAFYIQEIIGLGQIVSRLNDNIN